VNVQVKHNGTTITGFVTEYERVHKICTGIGTLTLQVINTIGRTFVPWDNIDIYENGDFKVRYYVSSVENNIPRGTISLDCQDNSKRIVDYFIPDSYTVDYPSYTRYWIEKFLTEAGVDFEFNTTSQGNLLSNFTNLGLTTVYEQITTLLQMSGWYFYFDGNGKAIIGSLQTDLAEDRDSVGKTDILNIEVIKDDKMLRNKALVFGAYDPFAGTNAKASVTVHTPWNYDHNDIRPIVISNSNIPDNETAYGMANQIVKEFSRITVEKHLSVWGARDFNLGTALRVTSNIYKGRGLVTTFGVSMSKGGLITNVVLDERCPRLFGFFDFGDYVYVSFYGDGVWRKHIKFDPTWYNFSTGLTDLAITDLHVNNGVFGSVGTRGEMFYAIDELPWNGISFSSFMSSEESVVDASGNFIAFSGLMARAVIIDKIGNTVKFGVDTMSGINMGDYFMNASGFSTTASGNRSWIVEYDVLSGNLAGTSYPVSLSGNYNYFVVDLDNDGKNDYISVGTGGTAAPPVLGTDHNYGHHYTQGFANSKDYTSYTIFPDAQSIVDINNEVRGSMESLSVRVQNQSSMIAIDDQISGYSFIVAVGADKVARKDKYTRTFSAGAWNVARTETVSSAQTNIGTVLGIYPNLGSDTHRIFYYKKPSQGSIDFYYIDWNALANTWGSQTLIQTVTLQTGGTAFLERAFRLDSVVSGNVIKVLMTHIRSQNNSTVFTAESHLFIEVTSISMETATLINDPVLDFITDEYLTSGRYYYFSDTGHSAPTFPDAIDNGNNPPYFHIFQNGQDVQIIGRIEMFYNDITAPPNLIFSTREFLFSGNASVVQYNEVYNDTQVMSAYSNIRRFTGVFEGNWLQLTTSNAIIVGHGNSIGLNSFVWDGATFLTYTSAGNSTTIPYYFKKSTVFPMFANNQNQYIALNSSTFNIVSADSLSVIGTIVPPANVYPNGFCSTGFGGFGASVYASVFIDDADGFDWLVPFDFTSFDLGRKLYTQDDGSNSVPSFSIRTISFGNFFISDSNDYTAVQPVAGVYYVDLGSPEWEAAVYQVLRRDDATTFTLIEEEAYPIRLDISNNAPVLTVGSGDTTFVSNYVYETTLTTVESAPSGLAAFSGQMVNDYRYTFLQPSPGTLSSGLGISSTILYIHGSGIFGSDALTYSGGFSKMFDVPSGYGTRIETSNYGVGGQYIFITASGNVQRFYQQDPAAFSFTDYGTGFPQTRATQIRLDDAV